MSGFLDRVVARALGIAPVVHRRREPEFAPAVHARRSLSDDVVEREADRADGVRTRRQSSRLVPLRWNSAEAALEVEVDAAAQRRVTRRQSDAFGEFASQPSEPSRVGVMHPSPSERSLSNAPVQPAPGQMLHANESAFVPAFTASSQRVRELANSNDLNVPSGVNRRGAVPAVSADKSEVLENRADRNVALRSPENQAAGSIADGRPASRAEHFAALETFEWSNERDDGSVDPIPSPRRLLNAHVTNDVLWEALPADRVTSERPSTDDLTVNVSIGRIDVARPAQPSPPALPARPGSPRPSLDDYLRLRQKVRGR